MSYSRCSSDGGSADAPSFQGLLSLSASGISVSLGLWRVVVEVVAVETCAEMVVSVTRCALE